MGVGDKIRSLRRDSGLTQKEFGSLFGLEAGAIGTYENETRSPSMEFLVKLADKYEISIDWLLGRTASKNADFGKKNIIDTLGASEIQELYKYAKYLKIRSTLEGSGGSPESSATSDVS